MLLVNDSWLQADGKYKCPECGETFTKKGIFTHVWRKHGAGIAHDPNKGYQYKDGRTAWNKGLTKDSSVIVRNIGLTLSDRIAKGEVPNHWKGKTHTEEAKLKISVALSQNNKGGRCKWYTHTKLDGSEHRVQGTWELRFARIADILDPEWIKPGTGDNTTNHLFKWIDDSGKVKHYTPDFFFPALGIYYEIKGFWWGNDKRKMELVHEQHPGVSITVIDREALEAMELRYGLGPLLELSTTKPVCSCPRLRPRKPVVKRDSYSKIPATRDELYDLLYVQRVPMVELGRRFGCSDNAVRKRAKALGLETKRGLK